MHISLNPPTNARTTEAVLADINDTFGKGTVMRMNESAIEGVETIPSGSLTLDLALGGGFPVGRIIEIYGPGTSLYICTVHYPLIQAT